MTSNQCQKDVFKSLTESSDSKKKTEISISINESHKCVRMTVCLHFLSNHAIMTTMVIVIMLPTE